MANAQVEHSAVLITIAQFKSGAVLRDGTRVKLIARVHISH